MHYWPLTYTTFWLEHKIWGLAPAGYHVVNVLLHLLNSLLVWRLLLRLAVPGAWVAAAVFAAHPTHVESVAWIIERKDVLSGLFYLTAVLVWLRFLEQPRPWRYGLTLLLFVAGLLSKSIVVTLPAALLIVQWWKDGRIAVRDLQRLAPFFPVALLITAVDLSPIGSRHSLLDYSLPERMLLASRALWFYAGKLAWPSDLAVIYPRWDSPISLGDPWAWAPFPSPRERVQRLKCGQRRRRSGGVSSASFPGVLLLLSQEPPQAVQVPRQHRQRNHAREALGAVGADPVETAMLQRVDRRLHRRMLPSHGRELLGFFPLAGGAVASSLAG